jgi:Flp pilus assembly protein TadG
MLASHPSGQCRQGTRQTAATTVEFAFIAVFLSIILGGMIELGHAISVKQVLTNVSRRGAYIGVKANKTYTDIQNAVDDILATDQQLPTTLANGKAQLTVTVATWDPVNQVYGSDTPVTSSTFAPNQYDKVGVKVWVNASDVALVFLNYMSGRIEGETVYMMKQ